MKLDKKIEEKTKKETINALCDDLKMYESGRHGNQNYAKGYNQAVEELNKKLEDIKNE